MSRQLKVFETRIGFYDVIVASPSMKAAAEAWGSKPAIFTRGLAAVTQEANAVQAALAYPGTVLKRPHGHKGQYKADPDPIPMPKLSRRQNEVAKKAATALKHKLAAQKRAQLEAARKSQKQAQEQLAAIEREEAALRDRRRALQEKFHLRSVK